MTEFSNLYYYMKNMSEESPESNEIPCCKSTSSFKVPKTPITPDTIRPDPFSEECLHRLELKHVDQKMIKHTVMAQELLYQNDFGLNQPLMNDNSIKKAIEHDYLIQPSNRKVEMINATIPDRPKQINLKANNKNRSDFNPMCIAKDLYSNTEPNESQNNSNIITRANSHTSSVGFGSPQESHSVVTPTGQDELAEIIKDFKNNVFTISEVEKLVMDWRNRNETQQSLKEKQEQLNKMREEYDKLQRRIKDDMKRPTPFERVRKIFSKGKSKS